MFELFKVKIAKVVIPAILAVISLFTTPTTDTKITAPLLAEIAQVREELEVRQTEIPETTQTSSSTEPIPEYAEECLCVPFVRNLSKYELPELWYDGAINIPATKTVPKKGGWVLFKANFGPYGKYAHAAFIQEVFNTPNGEFIEMLEDCFPPGEGGSKRIIRSDDPSIRGYYWYTPQEKLIIDKEDFVHISLDAMALYLYKDGMVYKEFSIEAKASPWGAWQTPTGEFEALHKELDHWSTLFEVWMPYSIHFEGNFFIHGRTYYSNGVDGTSAYTGGCLRLSNENMKEVYEFIKLGMPILIK